MAETWEEISQAETEQRHELHLNGDLISQKIEEKRYEVTSCSVWPDCA